MNKKDLAIVALATFCLTATLFMVLPIRSDPYDPWLDTNDDGSINILEGILLSNHFLTSGDPTKNVTVTNLPLDVQGNVKVSETGSGYYPQKLVLQGGFINDSSGSYRGILLEQELPRLNILTSDTQQLTNGTHDSWTTIYNTIFTHEELPVQTYNISGKILGTITLHVHMSGNGYDNLDIKGIVAFGEVLNSGLFVTLLAQGISEIHTVQYKDGIDVVLPLTYVLDCSTPLVMPTTRRIGILIQINARWHFLNSPGGYLEFLTNKATDFMAIIPIVS